MIRPACCFWTVLVLAARWKCDWKVSYVIVFVYMPASFVACVVVCTVVGACSAAGSTPCFV
jgi:hypothetical protein